MKLRIARKLRMKGDRGDTIRRACSRLRVEANTARRRRAVKIDRFVELAADAYGFDLPRPRSRR